MNEILEQRISAVQNGKNTTHANIAAKRDLREQLESEVAKFLAKKNEVKSLEFGFSHFPDGIIPRARVQVKTTEQEQKERDGKIAETNRQVREANAFTAKQKTIRAVKAELNQPHLKALQVEQKELLQDVYQKYGYKVITAIANHIGVKPKTIVNARNGSTRIGADTWPLVKRFIAITEFEPIVKKPKAKKKSSPEQIIEQKRRKAVSVARAKAQLNGQSVFLAPCRKHGEAKYYLHGDQPPRCSLCLMERHKNHIIKNEDAEQKDTRQRSEFNKQEMVKALESGSLEFTGLCRACGYGPFKTAKCKKSASGHKYYCRTCLNKSQEKYNEKGKAA